MDIDYKAIGKRIKIARIRQGLTQETLSNIIGLSPSHLSNIETGSTKVSLPTIIHLANALHLSVDDILSDNIVHSKINFEKDIANIIEDCDEYEIRFITNILRAVKETLRRESELRNYHRE